MAGGSGGQQYPPYQQPSIFDYAQQKPVSQSLVTKIDAFKTELFWQSRKNRFEKINKFTQAL